MSYVWLVLDEKDNKYVAVCNCSAVAMSQSRLAAKSPKPPQVTDLSGNTLKVVVYPNGVCHLVSCVPVKDELVYTPNAGEVVPGNTIISHVRC